MTQFTQEQYRAVEAAMPDEDNFLHTIGNWTVSNYEIIRHALQAMADPITRELVEGLVLCEQALACHDHFKKIEILDKARALIAKYGGGM